MLPAEAAEVEDIWRGDKMLRIRYDPRNPKRQSVVDDAGCQTCTAVRGVFGSCLLFYGIYVMI